MKKVRLYENERLDIPDALGLQDEIYGYVARFFGAIVGDCEGVSDALKIDYAGWNQNKTVEISGSAYILKTFSSERYYENEKPEGFLNSPNVPYPGANAAYCFHFNSEYSPKEVDLSALYASTIDVNKAEDALEYSIFARRIRINSDTETRRFWDEATGGETSQNVETRTKSSLEWTVGLSTDPSLTLHGWIRVFDCVGINPASGEQFNENYAKNDYGENVSGALLSPVFRPVLFWDYVRQRSPHQKAALTGVSGLEISDGDFLAIMPGSEGSIRNDYTLEATGKFSWSAFRHPSQAVLGSASEEFLVQQHAVLDPAMQGTGEIHPKILDMLTALEGSSSDVANAGKTNPGILALLTAITEQLCELKYGPISGLRSWQINKISPWAFTGVGEVLPPYKKKLSTTVTADAITQVIDTGAGGLADDTEDVNPDKQARANLNTVRPLSHLNQLYNNWGRAHPQVLLSGMLCTRIDAPAYADTETTERFSNFKWYGPLYNPLGFELVQHNGALRAAMTGWQQDQNNYLYPEADNNVSNAYAVMPRMAPSVSKDYCKQGEKFGPTFGTSATGVPDAHLTTDQATGWGAPGGTGDHEQFNRGLFNGGYDLLIKPPGGIDDDELHIFSVQCTETSSWGPNKNMVSQWPVSPYGYFPPASQVAGDAVKQDQDNAVAGNIWNLRAHVGKGFNLYTGANHNSLNNIFVMCQPPPRWKDGEITQTDANYVRYCWFFITVLGVAPNHLTADRVFRGQRSYQSTDRAMLDSYWQYKWAQPYISSYNGAGYTSDGTISLYGPDSAALSLANQRNNNHPDTSYLGDGSGMKGGNGGFWSYARPDQSNT